MDGGNNFTGAVISPHYDSMLAKITASALTYEEAVDKLTRALRETRIRGVKTNIGFTLNVLKHPEFRAGAATTSFIEDHPELFEFSRGGDRASKLLESLRRADTWSDASRRRRGCGCFSDASRRRRGRDADIPRRRVAAATWIVRGDESRRRCGHGRG